MSRWKWTAARWRLSGNGANYFTNGHPDDQQRKGRRWILKAVNSPNVATEIEGYLNGRVAGTFFR